jgi:tRNA pseudouridine38-40 synthase
LEIASDETDEPLLPPEDMGELRAFRLLVEYDGTNYSGWQRQPESPSVQQSIEEALEYITRHPVRCFGAGRTDAGVHALGQVARVLTTAPNVDEEALVRGGNRYLPEDIRILSAEPCELSFDPRRDARLRWYRYSILNRLAPSALERNRLVHLPGPIDWDAVEEGMAALRGQHDFRAFRSSSCVATRTALDLTEARHVNEHPVHHFDFKCRSFLQHMVRFMSGALIEVGMGKLRVEDLRTMLSTGRRFVSFRLAPAHGLVLTRVYYEGKRELNLTARRESEHIMRKGCCCNDVCGTGVRDLHQTIREVDDAK